MSWAERTFALSFNSYNLLFQLLKWLLLVYPAESKSCSIFTFFILLLLREWNMKVINKEIAKKNKALLAMKAKTHWIQILIKRRMEFVLYSYLSSENPIWSSQITKHTWKYFFILYLQEIFLYLIHFFRLPPSPRREQ